MAKTTKKPVKTKVYSVMILLTGIGTTGCVSYFGRLSGVDTITINSRLGSADILTGAITMALANDTLNKTSIAIFAFPPSV